MGCLYRLDFPSGKSYVGITTKTAEERFASHTARARQGHSVLLANALRKHGPAAVQVKTLVVCDDWQALCLMEQSAIRVYETLAPNGYNMTSGGEGVSGFSEEVLKKKSAKARGRKMSAEFCEHRAADKVRQWADSEYRATLIPKLLKSRARRSMFHYASIQVRTAYGECLREKRECSLIA